MYDNANRPIVTEDYAPKPRRSPKNIKRRQIREQADESSRLASKFIELQDRNIKRIQNSTFGEFGV